MEPGLAWLYIILTLVAGIVSQKKDYSGYQVLRIYHTNINQEEIVKDLIQAEELQIDVWGESDASRSIDMEVPPASLAHVKHILSDNHMNYEVDIANLQSEINREDKDMQATNMIDKMIEDELKRRSKRAAENVPRTVTDFDIFYNFSIVGRYERHAYMKLWMLAAQSVHPGLVKVFDIGNTTENRQLHVIKIGHEDKNKPAIFIDANIHAREWITSATAIYIIDYMLRGYNVDKNVTDLVNHFNWYILPVANPDGYEYTHTTDRMWRKTRSRSKERPECIGVDPNRNWDFHWMDCCGINRKPCTTARDKVGCSSANPCNNLYAGPKAFSEPETKHIADFILDHKNEIDLYMTLHSYTQKWLTPWGYTKNRPKDHTEMHRLAQIGRNALNETHGTYFEIGSPAHILYAAAGGSYDWAKGVANVTYSYALELRDNGTYGFILPQEQVIPTGEEVWAALEAIALDMVQRKSKSG